MTLRCRTGAEAARRAVFEAALATRDWPAQPLQVTAIDAASGEFTAFDAGSGVTLIDAVGASCAVPGVWPPVTIGGRRYIDGGVHSVTNLDLTTGLGLDLVVVSSAMSGTAATLGRADLLIRAASGARLAWESAAVRRSGTRVAVFQPDASVRQAMGLNLMDGRRRREVTRAAIQSTRRRLESGGLEGGIAPLLG
jgi:NTE family protein